MSYIDCSFLSRHDSRCVIIFNPSFIAAKQTESVACILTALRHRNIEFTVVRSQPPAIRRRYCTLVRRIPPLQPIAARKSSLPLSARRASAACAGSRTHAFARTPQRTRALARPRALQRPIRARNACAPNAWPAYIAGL